MKRELSKEVKEYLEFMYNPDNARNCEECPESRKYDDFQHRLPCGQWHCWVELHCGGENNAE